MHTNHFIYLIKIKSYICNYIKYFPFPTLSNVFNRRSVNGIVVLILKCQQVCGKGKFILVVVNVAFSGLATTQMLSEC